MSDDTKPIKCARCKIAVQVRTESDGQRIAFCPTCGEHDKLEIVTREAGEFAAQKLHEEMQSSMQRTFSGSKNIKFTPGTIPQRSYRFIIDTD